MAGQEIVTSTGVLGYDGTRTHRRGYNNHSGGESLHRVFAADWEQHGKGLGPDGRMVTRGIVDTHGLQELLRESLALNGSGPRIEAIAPFPGGDRHLVVLAQNHSLRRSPRDVASIIEGVVADQENVIPQGPQEHIDSVHSQEHRFVAHIPEVLSEDLLNLWEHAFDWDRSQIKNLRNSMDKEESNPAENKTLWFSGIVNNDGELVVATMAQRLDFPTGDIVVESTEWSAVAGRGMGAAAVSVLNAQILYNLTPEQRARTIIYAETNERKRAHKTARRAGMHLPPTSYVVDDAEVFVSQIFEQNVAVGDGIEGEGYHIPGDRLPLRDFSMQYLSDQARADLYPDSVLKYVIDQVQLDDTAVRQQLAGRIRRR